MGKSAPKPDARIGEAALRSAQLGEEYLGWMQGLSEVTTGWATEDRERYQRTFQPLEDRYVAEAADYASPERKAQAATEAVGDVRQQAAMSHQMRERNLTSMGVNPASGRFAGEDRRAAAGETLAAAGAANMARRQVEAIGDSKMSNAINLGKGLAVNPATSMGMTASMGGSGFQGAMQGQGQMGNLLNTQYQNQLQYHQMQNQGMAGIGGAIGSIVGALPMLSSKEYKKDKRKAMGVLDAVKSMPVEEWEYKEGIADGGKARHVGPYAEDFQKATGLGNGKEISVIDAVGVNMGATQELATQVERLEKKIDQIGTGRGKASGRSADRDKPGNSAQARWSREISVMEAA
ncbi:tail fiber domain-containing protein [Pararhodobacter sp.]|uniref:tail fiber domain-containing protein n=1 Tax=Pararhodobacter sp. TaxID=2127056 RepID=UPI002FDDC16F